MYYRTYTHPDRSSPYFLSTETESLPFYTPTFLHDIQNNNLYQKQKISLALHKNVPIQHKNWSSAVGLGSREFSNRQSAELRHCTGYIWSLMMCSDFRRTAIHCPTAICIALYVREAESYQTGAMKGNDCDQCQRSILTLAVETQMQPNIQNGDSEFTLRAEC